MLGNFLATHIRHCLCFQMLPCHQRPLMGCVILPALVTSLVPRIRQPMKRGLLELAAHLIAVALATVVRPADMEPSAASGTSQLEDNELVHPARRDENWTATSASSTVSMYWLSIRRLYARVQAPTWALFRLSAVPTYRNASRRATSWPVPQIDRLMAEQLEKTSRGPARAGKDLVGRPVLHGDPLPGLEGAPG
jgi:hypothetical protein